MVTCPHALASQAGVDVLRAGGSAVDAAIATSAALSVIYPHMCGLGGDAFWLIYDAKLGQVRYLDGGGRAAATADIDWFRERGQGEIPFRGILPATRTTPGAVASWCKAHTAYGQMPGGEAFLRVARPGNGAPVHGARHFARVQARLDGEGG
ncbi:MAG: gamma-glutamyltransferase [Proteobacteria bacterium]|nr:gamma-glutamyltransferase [Pseudomonadota bacterium]